MTLHIELEMDNAAFEPNRRGEIKRILTKIASAIFAGDDPRTLRDINGNTCGTVDIEL